MSVDESRYTEALRQIARIATDVVGSDTAVPAGGDRPVDTADAGLHCWRTMTLPDDVVGQAAAFATQVNPANAPPPLPATADAVPIQPGLLVLLTSKYWGPAEKTLSVSFMEATPADLRARILLHMNAWSQACGISFTQTSGTGDVRISRGPGGYWSYLGTDIRLVPPGRQTMNLQGFTMTTPDSEYRRVVTHETGHTLGFPHEHLRRELVDRIDPQKAYAYFYRQAAWSKEVVDQQVLTPLAPGSFTGTPPDQDSIMCYQLPGEITRDGRPIRGGTTIDATDYAFASKVYPKRTRAVQAEPPAYAVPAPRSELRVNWDAGENVTAPIP
jgi:hypothetical protein